MPARQPVQRDALLRRSAPPVRRPAAPRTHRSCASPSAAGRRTCATVATSCRARPCRSRERCRHRVPARSSGSGASAAARIAGDDRGILLERQQPRRGLRRCHRDPHLDAAIDRRPLQLGRNAHAHPPAAARGRSTSSTMQVIAMTLDPRRKIPRQRQQRRRGRIARAKAGEQTCDVRRAARATCECWRRADVRLRATC